MTAKKQIRQVSKNELIEKIKNYCAYAERCSYDVEQKLLRLGAENNFIPEVIEQLSEEQYIDNQRFAELFAAGKLHNNTWGKIKIRAELQKRNINEEHIYLALEGIDDQDYRQCLQSLIQKKRVELKNKHITHHNKRVITYCIQKGFEPHLVFELTGETST